MRADGESIKPSKIHRGMTIMNTVVYNVSQVMCDFGVRHENTCISSVNVVELASNGETLPAPSNVKYVLIECEESWPDFHISLDIVRTV